MPTPTLTDIMQHKAWVPPVYPPAESQDWLIAFEQCTTRKQKVNLANAWAWTTNNEVSFHETYNGLGWVIQKHQAISAFYPFITPGLFTGQLFDGHIQTLFKAFARDKGVPPVIGALELSIADLWLSEPAVFVAKANPVLSSLEQMRHQKMHRTEWYELLVGVLLWDRVISMGSDKADSTVPLLDRMYQHLPKESAVDDTPEGLQAVTPLQVLAWNSLRNEVIDDKRLTNNAIFLSTVRPVLHSTPAWYALSMLKEIIESASGIGKDGRRQISRFSSLNASSEDEHDLYVVYEALVPGLQSWWDTSRSLGICVEDAVEQALINLKSKHAEVNNLVLPSTVSVGGNG